MRTSTALFKEGLSVQFLYSGCVGLGAIQPVLRLWKLAVGYSFPQLCWYLIASSILMPLLKPHFIKTFHEEDNNPRIS